MKRYVDAAQEQPEKPATQHHHRMHPDRHQATRNEVHADRGNEYAERHEENRNTRFPVKGVCVTP
ncbi:MAG: hypothetical protein SF051_05980 [Elusimicrobiota bacterium]|nr:hypothetical protein [Elusimicrobiota bacterium]